MSRHPFSPTEKQDFQLRSVEDIRTRRDALDQALSSVIAELREQGTPWAAIAARLGTSPQAARERFTPRENRLPAPATSRAPTPSTSRR